MTREALKKNTMKAILWTGSAIPTLASWITRFLDWLVELTERLVVLAIAFVAAYVGWFALHGDKQKSDALVQMLKTLSDNWKGLPIRAKLLDHLHGKRRKMVVRQTS